LNEAAVGECRHYIRFIIGMLKLPGAWRSDRLGVSLAMNVDTTYPAASARRVMCVFYAQWAAALPKIITCLLTFAIHYAA